MTFTTLTFLLFLLVVFALYWGFPRRCFQNLLLVISSYVFYGWWDWRFCSLMLASSLLDYFVGLGLDGSDEPRQRKMLLSIALIGNLGMLGFFKYFNFFSESLAMVASSLGWNFDRPTLDVVLPVGISFYTFQTMSYSIDIYRREMRASRQLIEYLAYVSFFPQLVAGPIERATHLLPQFLRERSFDYEKAADGCRQMLWGFFKKMVIADNLAPLVELAFSDPATLSGAELAMATVLFAFQVYCDFSAYSDIAIGVARLFGFQLMRNFAYPYFSQSMTEFWRRWHISLTTWFRDYVYFPLGGSRVSPSRRAMNVLVTFLLSGLWHGASWNFITWGAINGLAVLPGALSSARRVPGATEVPGVQPHQPALLAVGRMLLTFALVCVGWIFFRARTLSDALLVVRKIATDLFRSDSLVDMLSFAYRGEAEGVVPLALVVLVAAEWFKRRDPHPLRLTATPLVLRWVVYSTLIWVVIYFGTFGGGQFIYFQF